MSLALLSEQTAGATTDRAMSPEADHLTERVQPSATARSWDMQAETALALLEACEAANYPGWDGPGSKPVSLATLRNALKLVGTLPSWVPAPEIAIYPDGEIEFEWHVGPGRVAGISVGETEILHYAGLFGDERAHGAVRFVDSFPGALGEVLARLGVWAIL